MARENNYYLRTIAEVAPASAIHLLALDSSILVVLTFSGTTGTLHFYKRNGIELVKTGSSSIEGIFRVSSRPLMRWSSSSGVVQYFINTATLGHRSFDAYGSLGPEITYPIDPTDGSQSMIFAANSSFGGIHSYLSRENSRIAKFSRSGNSHSIGNVGDIIDNSNRGLSAFSRVTAISWDTVAFVSRFSRFIVGPTPRIINLSVLKHVGSVWELMDDINLVTNSVSDGSVNFDQSIDLTRLTPTLFVSLRGRTPDGSASGDNRSWTIETHNILPSSFTGKLGAGNIQEVGALKGGSFSHQGLFGFFGTKYVAVVLQQATPETRFLQIQEAHVDNSGAVSVNPVSEAVTLTDYPVTAIKTEELTNTLGAVLFISSGIAYLGIIERVPFAESGAIEPLVIPRKRYPAWLGDRKLEELWPSL